MMIEKAESEAEKNASDIRQFIDQDPAQLVKPISGQSKNFTMSRHVVPKAMCDYPVFVSTQSADLIREVTQENVAKIMYA